jgi:peroxiredoxin
MKKRVKPGLLAAMLLLGFGFTSRPVLSEPPPSLLLYQAGDVAADFRLRNVDGQMVSLGDYRNGKGVIVVFTSNHCPYSRAYEDRLIALHQKFAGQGYPIVAINSNDPAAYEEDSFENMKVRARDKSFPFPYLVDDTQRVAKTYGAARSPHVLVLRKTGEQFVVQYVGAIDDNTQDPGSVTRRYVDEAVTNLLAGKPVVSTSTRSVGCAIKWKD